FVIDVPRVTVAKYVGNLQRDVGSVAAGDIAAPYGGDRFPLNPFRFTDYDGVMGVPISFLYKYSPEQFEIVGMRNVSMI
ncbi:MAG: adenine-specific methyltransferase EcoRI family protein, partial [Thiobacillaceae bacterium]